MARAVVVSGFLGAGKTTLLKRMVETCWQGEKTVLVENEFGEVGVDGAFLRQTGLEIRELTSGCICCSLAGDFTKALCEIIQRFAPDRVVIEPSGVAKLSDILRGVQQAAERVPLTLSCAIAVCDAGLCRDYAENFGEFYMDQVQNADLILLSHVDETDGETLRSGADYLGALNNHANVIAAPWQALDAATLREALETAETKRGPSCAQHGHDSDCHQHGHADGRHQAGQVFLSWSREHVGPYTESALRRMAEELACGSCGVVLRAKGVIPGQDGMWLEFDYTRGRADVRRGQPQETGAVCVIGTGLNECELEKLFSNDDTNGGIG